ncbi:serine/threonine-protein kinase [Streptomyces sp. NPDC019224]|uniref:serine/threonine protein kinase n=1 Tax=Streptomyces sp. NPDC019224 TaxID=3154484 RepID=UPI0033EAD543
MRQGDPQRVGPYRVVGRLGSGGMGIVYAALSAAGERMAVKVVHPAQASDDEFRARFRREVHLSRRVTGPCLVPVVDADPDAPAPWLATAFIPGPTLDQHVAADGALAGARLYALAAGTAAALAAVHQAGVTHRDVKPQNVILAASGPMVLDFGIAHALDGTSVTRTGVMTGTPGWISPEHYRTGAVGPEGDVFAWGGLVAYAATGRLPFGSGAADAVAFRVLSAEPDLDGMGDDLRQLVERALSKDPSVRPAAAELAQLCGGLLAKQTTAVAGPAGLPQPTLIADLVGRSWDLPSDEPIWPGPPKRTSRTGLYLAVVAAAALVGSLGGILAATQSSTTAREPALASDGQKAPSVDLTSAAQHSVSSAPSPARTASPVPSPSTPSPRTSTVPSPAYTRGDSTQPTVDEWAAARVPATRAEKAAAQRLREDAAPILQGQQYTGGQVTVTFNPSAQTMFITFGPGIYPEGESYQDDATWTDVVRSLMFGSCSEAQQDFLDDITWPYGRAAVVYRESMASPIIANFREVTHTDSCRV